MINFDTLEYFQYSPLANPTRDIRIIELLPGHFDDDIRICLRHTPLVEPQTKPTGRLSVKELSQPLSDLENHVIHYTRDDRFVFETRRNGKCQYSWTHPVSTFAKAKYLIRDEVHHGDPTYEALSYIWGTRLHSNFIAITDVIGLPRETHSRNSRKHPVGKNLWVCLKHLRQPVTIRTLWIDAICINQVDAAEKATQVRRMADIYRLAYRVIVWMGLLPLECQRVDTLGKLAKLGEQMLSSDSGIVPCPDAKGTGWHHPDYDLTYDDETWRSIALLFDNPYSQRLWPLQETGLANRLGMMQWGHSVVSIVSIYNAVRAIINKRTSMNSKIRGLLNPLVAIRYTLDVRKGLPMETLMIFATDRNCTDPRDKVFGLLGLMAPRIASLVEPDYTDASTTAAVFKKAFVAWSTYVHRLDLLIAYRDVPYEKPCWPSWLPDWSAEPSYKRILRDSFVSGCSRAHFHHKELGTLVVTGVQCGVVDLISDELDEDFQSTCRHVTKLSGGAETPLTSSILESYCYVMNAGYIRNRWRGAVSFPGRAECTEEMRKTISGNGTYSAPSSVTTNCAQYCWHRRFFLLKESRRVGLGSGRALPGDVVSIFLGSRVAKLLRPIGRGRYNVVGDCFVAGLTECAAFLGPLPQPWIVRADPGYRGRVRYRFFNEITGGLTVEDPRLEPLEGTDWERMEYDPKDDDPNCFDYFRNIATGEIMNSDPRLLPRQLRQKGIALEEFELV